MEKRTKNGSHDARTVQGRKAIAREEKWAEIGSALHTYQEAKKQRDDAKAVRRMIRDDADAERKAEKHERSLAELRQMLQPIIEQIEAAQKMQAPKEKGPLFDFLMEMRSRCFSTPVTRGGKNELVSKQKELCMVYYEKYNQGIYLAKMLYATEPEFVGLFKKSAEVDKEIKRKKKVKNEDQRILRIILIGFVVLFAGAGIVDLLEEFF